jgi:hypothetical protein
VSGSDSYAGADYSLSYLDLAVVRGPELLLCKQYALGVDLASRVAVIQRALDELISMPYAPSVIAMEQPWVREGRGVRSALELHAIPHYVTALAAERGIETRFVAVPTWRSVVLGNGKLSHRGREGAVGAVREPRLSARQRVAQRGGRRVPGDVGAGYGAV